MESAQKTIPEAFPPHQTRQPSILGSQVNSREAFTSTSKILGIVGQNLSTVGQLLLSFCFMVMSLGSTLSAYVLSIAYGIKTQPTDDPLVTLSQEAIQILNDAYFSPVSFLIYLVPVLQYLPEWCLGSNFRRQARKARRMAHEFKTAPFEEAERLIVSLVFHLTYQTWA